MKKWMGVLAILAAFMSASAWAEDGAVVYKTRCANCHGAAGEGKAKLGPKLVGTEKSADDITALVTKGSGTKAPHSKPLTGLAPERAKAAAGFVKSLK
jgi:mono/diheme cytochrome c family protein